MGAASSSVPCGSCTLCCRGQPVFLRPGEDARGLVVVVDIIPGTNGRRALRLPLTPEGDCAYLGAEGCTVYDQRPWVCRSFDCREHYFKPAAERRRLEAEFGRHDMQIVRRGRELAERAQNGTTQGDDDV